MLYSEKKNQLKINHTNWKEATVLHKNMQNA